MSQHSGHSSTLTRLSSYREKRAESRPTSSSNTNSKALEQIQESLRSNLRRRGLSQSFIEVQPVGCSLQESFRTAQGQIPSQRKLIEKYQSDQIMQVAEEEILLQSGHNGTTTTKDKPLLKTPLVKKHSSLLEKSTQQTSSRNLHEKTLKIETGKGLAVVQERKTVVKGQKPAVVQPLSAGLKTEKKVEKRGIGVVQSAKQDFSVQIHKVEQLQDELMRVLHGDRASQVSYHLNNILSLLRDP